MNNRRWRHERLAANGPSTAGGNHPSADEAAPLIAAAIEEGAPAVIAVEAAGVAAPVEGVGGTGGDTDSDTDDDDDGWAAASGLSVGSAAQALPMSEWHAVEPQCRSRLARVDAKLEKLRRRLDEEGRRSDWRGGAGGGGVVERLAFLQTDGIKLGGRSDHARRTQCSLPPRDGKRSRRRAWRVPSGIRH